mgnify:CR=1 FL=1
MCCLFGIHDYGHSLTQKQKNRLLSILGTACEARGTDATGIAYNAEDKLCIYKRPRPAHWMRFQVPPTVDVIMGHTRMTTQGNERKNHNNHPFPGYVRDRQFALAHNGVLYNDLQLRKECKLPVTKIETDSYIATQLIESCGELNFGSMQYMAEKLEGSYTFTVLSDRDELYFIKGDNPMCLYHYPERGLYVYASTEEILRTALRQFSYSLGTPVRVDMVCGDILQIDKHGHQDRSNFDTSKLFRRMYEPWMDFGFQSAISNVSSGVTGSYLDDLKSIAMYYGLYPEDIDSLINDGMDPMEIEEMLYCG